MASFPRASMAFNRIEAMAKDGGSFMKQIENAYPNVHFQAVSLTYLKK
jgi:hypothetical protein